MEKELFEDCFGDKFQKKINKMSHDQHDDLIKHIFKVCPGISYTEKEDCYVFSSEYITIEHLTLIWDYLRANTRD